MNIALFAIVDLNENEGSKAHFTNLATEMVNIDPSVKIYLPSKSDQNVGNSIYSFLPVSSKYRKFKTALTGLLVLPQLFKKLSLDHITHLYMRNFLFSWVVVLYIRMFTKIKVITEHNSITKTSYTLEQKPKLVAILGHVGQWIDMRFSHAVRGVTKEIVGEFTEIKKSNVLIIGNGSHHWPVTQRSIENTNQFKIGFLGKPRPWHGLEKFIKGFEYYTTNYSDNVSLAIVGDSDYVPSLQERFEHTKNIEWRSGVPYEDVFKTLKTFDVGLVFNLTLNYSWSPIKLSEYAMASLPVLTNLNESFCDVGKFQFGVAVCEDDAKAIAEGIKMIFSDSKQYIQMSSNAYEYANNNYSWQEIVNKIYNFIVAQ